MTAFVKTIFEAVVDGIEAPPVDIGSVEGVAPPVASPMLPALPLDALRSFSGTKVSAVADIAVAVDRVAERELLPTCC